MLKKIVLSSVLISLSLQSMAGSLPDPRNFPVGKPTLECVAQAARDHKVPFAMLLGVNSIERGNTGQNVGNSNGSLDTGAFQINSIHFARAKKLNATHADLSSRGCFNAQFAAMLLSEALAQPKKQHLDIYTRGAGYHSWTPKYNAIYRKKLVRYTADWQAWLNDNTQQAQQAQFQTQQPQVQQASNNNPFTSGFLSDAHNPYRQ